MRNSWNRQHCPSLCLGKGGVAVLAQEAGKLCSELVTDLPSPRSFLAALQHLLAYAAGLSPLASCIWVWFHTALMTLNPNCAAAWPVGEKVTGDPITNPLVSFSLRFKFRIGDAEKAKLDYCFLYFPKGCEDAGMLGTLPARLREKSPCEPMYAMSCKFIVLFRLVLSSAVWDASAVLAVGNINQVGGTTLVSVQEAVMWGKFL